MCKTYEMLAGWPGRGGRSVAVSILNGVTLLVCLLTPTLFAENDSQTWVKEMFHRRQLTSLIPDFNDSYGVVFRDLNNDGYADIYVVRFRDLNRVFINQGPADLFMDFTIQTGLGGNLMSTGEKNLELGASAVDFNNDGRQDVMNIGWGVTTYLFQQTGNLQFNEKITLAEQFFPIDGNAGIWADVDLDGNLDLFVTDEHYENRLLMSDGIGDFVDKTEIYQVGDKSISQGAAFADVDNDGFPDLYVCNWFARDKFYRNVGGEKFVQVNLPLPHLQDSLKSNGVTFADIDNDGDLDLLVTDREGQSRLYENNLMPNNPQWRFRDITEQAALDNPFPAYGSVVADFNNDGWQDVFYTNIGPNRLYMNSGYGRFNLVFSQKLPVRPQIKYYSTGAAVADYDNDGDLDLFVANKDTVSVLYKNPLAEANSAIRIKLEGVTSNRDAIGSKIWLYEHIPQAQTARLAAYREISGGSGYLSMNENVVHFGVKPAQLYNARILFPSGKQIFLDNLQGGEVYQAVEVAGMQKTLTRGFQYIERLTHGKDFFLNIALFTFWITALGFFIVFAFRRYKWRNNPTIFFLFSPLVLGYLISVLMSGQKLWLMITVQIGLTLGLMTIIVAFMEKIHRIEMRRSGHRQLLRNFSQQLIFIKDNEALYEKMVAAINDSMNLTYCAAFTVNDNQAYFKTVAGEWESKGFQFEVSEKNKALFLSQAHLKPNQLAEKVPVLQQENIHLLIPLVRQDRLFAILLLGEDTADNKALRPEDIGILEIFASQAAIAIENNLYIEETKTLIQRLTETEITEKYVSELEDKNERLQQLFRELQETQAQLVQSEKLAGLGQLVAGIAHELNNPISFVYANMKELQHYILAITELLSLMNNMNNGSDMKGKVREKLQQLDEKYDFNFIQKDIDELISESLVGSERVKTVVQNLRNFSRLDEAEYKRVDLHEGLDSTLLLLNNELKNRINVHKDYDALPEVYCNPGNLNQVFMNLLLNASQAIEEKGDIWVSTRQQDNRVQIEIRDNGRGIPADIQQRIFDPFFTTKPVGKGTGLGLSISYNIIKKHNGKLECKSEVGVGTTFTVTLPVTSADKPMAEQSTTAEQASQ